MDASEQQFRQLSEWLQFTQEEERTRLARFLHDGPAQALTALRMDLNLLAGLLAHAPADVIGHLRSAVELTDEAIESIRQTSTDLRPGILTLGLSSAIDWQAQEFHERYDIPCAVNLAVDDSNWNPQQTTAIFRSLQESLILATANQSSRVAITLLPDPEAFVFTIRIEAPAIPPGWNSDPLPVEFLSMQVRASSVGAAFSTAVTPESALTISLRIPRNIAP